MKIKIYQIDVDRYDDDVAFASLDETIMRQGESRINSEIYDKVFDGDIDCETLEDVYTKFNIDLPTGYRGRSLSKSDIVEVENKNGVERSFWFCDSFGFAEVGFEPELTQDAIKGTMISVLLVEPGKYPRMVEIDRGLLLSSFGSKGVRDPFVHIHNGVVHILNHNLVNELGLNGFL